MPIAPTVYIPSRSEAVIKDVFRKFNKKGSGWDFYREIAKVYAKLKRFYHTFEGHIEMCLKEFWRVKKFAKNPEAVMMALVLHDVIMDFRRSDNEEKSAEFARDILKRMNAPEEFQEEVAELILATKHEAVPVSEDAKMVVDIDLSILAKNRWQFYRYEKNIRKEYAFVPEETFRTKRAEILEKFLERPQIFSLEYFREKYEERARKNLERSIKKLRS